MPSPTQLAILRRPTATPGPVRTRTPEEEAAIRAAQRGTSAETFTNATDVLLGALGLADEGTAEQPNRWARGGALLSALPMLGSLKAAVLGRQLKLPIKWPIKKPSQRLYWGSTLQRPTLPDPKRAVETPFTSFATDNPDIADIFTLPREYGEVLTHTAEGRPIKPGVITEFDYFPSDRTLVLEGPSAQKFIDDSTYQAQLATRARKYGYDAVVAKNVREGVGVDTARGNVYALLNAEGMQNPRKFKR